MSKMITPTMRRSADELLSRPRWARARDNRSGTPGYAFSSKSSAGVTYLARQDGLWCECPGFTNRNICCHVVAVRERVERPSTADAERARRERLRALLANE